ncbi:MAG: nucleotidyltransferase substrate binding protein [Clostridiales bacterium]|nr:nucleotidyltransferase substrate binding protein [Clostridiales bacterium]
MPSKDTQWLQRFQNYSRAFKLLQSALEDKDISEYSTLEQEGIIQMMLSRNALSHMYDFDHLNSSKEGK